MELPAMALAYVAGLAIAPWLAPPTTLPYWPWLLALGWFLIRRLRWAPLLLYAALLTLGLNLYQLALQPPAGATQLHRLVGPGERILEGTVIARSRSPQEESLELEATLTGVWPILTPTRGKVRLQIREGHPSCLPGERIRVLARLRLPRKFGTPGEFDYPRHLAHKGIFVTGSVEEARDIVRLGPAPQAPLTSWISRQRARLAQTIDHTVPATEAPLVRALAIGDARGITATQRDLLSRGGVSHLFAISGLHLGLIALGLYLSARSLYCRSETLLLLAPPRRFLPLFLMPLLAIYTLFTGSGLPTQRALLMCGAAALLLVLARRTPPLRLLLLAALLLLWLDPLALFEPGFQLSCAGVGGILTLLPRWQSRIATLPRLLRWPAGLLAATTAATLATTPIVLWHFHILAPAGLLANLVAVPLIGFAAVPLALVGTLAQPFSAATALCLQLCGWVVFQTLQLVEALLRLPGLAGQVLFLSPLQLLGPLLLAAAVLTWGQGRRLTLGLVVMGGLLAFAKIPAENQLAVTAISVGQGDATLLTLPGFGNLLVDGGGLYGDRFDTGERLVAPALARLGVRSLQAVLLTHNHPDHFKGLPFILEHFPVREFWSATPLEELDPRLQLPIKSRSIPLRRLPPGWNQVDCGERGLLQLFVPIQDQDQNDRSVVVLARFGHDGVLLPGDLESEGLQELLQQPLPAAINLLKLPHHGSRNSAPDLVLETIRPQIAFVSAGADNSHKLPHREVVELYTAAQTPLYRTDRLGSLRFVSAGTGWRASRFQEGLFR